MLARALIERKRDGGKVTAGEWRTLMRDYADGHVPDYQMSALAMAIYFQGLDRDEIRCEQVRGIRLRLSAQGEHRVGQLLRAEARRSYAGRRDSRWSGDARPLLFLQRYL